MGIQRLQPDSSNPNNTFLIKDIGTVKRATLSIANGLGFRTLLDVTGSGILRKLSVMMGGSGTALILTIDGVQYNYTYAQLAGDTSSSGGSFLLSLIPSNTTPNIFGGIEFKKSLKIQIDNGGWSGSSNNEAIYQLN